MNEIISALLPVFALILIGYAARYAGFPGSHFWQQAEKATYYVLFPVLLVSKLATSDMQGVDLGQTGLAVALLITLGSILSFILKPLIGGGAAGFTSFYQGGVRFNTYVGLAACAGLFGDESLALAAVIIAVMIPLLNLFCVLVFSCVTHRGSGVMATVKAIVKNPLIISCVLGITLNLTGLGLHHQVLSVAELLSRMALPMGLLAVGAALSFRDMFSSIRQILLSSLVKLLLFPLLAVGISILLGLDTTTQNVLLLFSALPTATSAYILSRQLGGDSEMMAAIITGQTLLAMITMPLVLNVMI